MGLGKKSKYTCEDCKAVTWLHWIETSRRARARCSACGSTRIIPTTEYGKEALLARQTNFVEMRHRIRAVQRNHPGTGGTQ